MADQVMIILQGLPGAGKSTWAAAWRDAAPQRREVVNRDQIRFELFGVYSGLTAEQEAVVSDIESLRGDRALGAGLSVVVDATNLESAHREVWVMQAARHGVRAEVVTIDTSLQECLRRNRSRGAAGGRLVPEDIIRGMAAAAECF
ncbi:hypothetical protein A7U43_27675 (plasmid) [Mycobacterium adipatum]|uniref:ATP-binding protein n=1 Tax=Mycobacterium adipatum TaxID=1682113 RepID=A0A172UWB5_9MYCO|nr:AAA family ATPase [Mycobacterium adipatum]ANE83325.1 hypothetical protein A7U43_27675 [Mycobacterium adipatum]